MLPATVFISLRGHRWRQVWKRGSRSIQVRRLEVELERNMPTRWIRSTEQIYSMSQGRRRSPPSSPPAPGRGPVGSRWECPVRRPPKKGALLSPIRRQKNSRCGVSAPQRQIFFIAPREFQLVHQPMAMVVLLGSSFFSCLGREIFRMPSSYLAEICSGWISPT